MGTSCAATKRFVKSTADQTGETFPRIGETTIRVVNKINGMSGNAAVIFGRWLGISDKSAKRKLDLERSISAEELGVLIRTERGFEIVTAIMGDANPEWWRICSAVMHAADIRKMQLAAQRRITKTLQGALDADRHLAATIARAEALAIHDAEFAGPQIDALRAVAGPSHRPMASTGRTKR